MGLLPRAERAAAWLAAVLAVGPASAAPAGRTTAAAAGAANPARREVDVVVDMTAEGRARAHPSASHPAYYYPIVGPFREFGEVVAGEKHPSANDLAHLVAVELAREGYFAIDRQHPNPSIILTVNWGYISPVEQDDALGDANTMVMNRNQTLGLIAGRSALDLNMNFDRERLLQMSDEQRSFVVLTAFDAPAYTHSHRKVELWQARMSTPARGTQFGTMMAALVRTGGPFFGRETTHPKMLLVPALPDGHVDVGTPTVKDYLDAPAPAPRKSSDPARRNPP